MSILEYEPPKKPDESSGTLFGIALAAFLAYWVVTPAVYQLLTGHAFVSTTQPTSQPALNPHDLVALSIASPCIGLLTLVIGNALWVKNGFSKLGLTIRTLREGGLLVGFLSGLVVVPAMFGVVLLSQKLFDLIHFSHPNEHDLLRALGLEASPLIRAMIIVSAVVLAPMFEEFFFRGMLQRAVRIGTNSPWFAIILASVVFTAVHGALWLAPPIFFLSICLGYLYERTRNLWVTMIVHGMFNATSIVMFLFFH